MKNLTLYLCFALASMSVAAQQADHAPLNQPDLNKPRLFSNLPERMPLTADFVNTLFDAQEGKTVSITAATDPTAARIEGKVVSTGSYDYIQTVVVRSTNFNGANLTISRFTDEDGITRYSGRIISREHGDAYVLKTESNGDLVLVRKDYYSLINE